MRCIGLLLVLSGLLCLCACGGDRALSQRQFTEMVQDRVEAEHSGILISHINERGFAYARGDGGHGRVATDDAYSYYLQHPEDVDDLIARVASLVDGRSALATRDTDMARLGRSILPVLKPRSFLGEADARSGGQPLLYGEHDSGLLVFFVLDQPTAISFLTAGSLSGLGLSREALTRLALDNLAHRTGEDRFVIERGPEGPIAVGETLDGYDAARLISPVLMTTASELLGASRVVAAVPRRDLILLAPDGIPALRERVQARARTEYYRGPFPITPDLFIVDRTSVRSVR